MRFHLWLYDTGCVWRPLLMFAITGCVWFALRDISDGLPLEAVSPDFPHKNVHNPTTPNTTRQYIASGYGQVCSVAVVTVWQIQAIIDWHSWLQGSALSEWV